VAPKATRLVNRSQKIGFPVPYSLWLTFDPLSEGRLREEIALCRQELARADFTPPHFAPHVTLIGDISLPLEHVEALVPQFSGALPCTVTATDLGTSPAYFMALFLAVDLPDAVNALRARIAEDIHGPGYRVDPSHASLAYGHFPDADKAALADAIRLRLRGQSFVLQSIGIVHSAKSIPVEEWRVVRSRTSPDPTSGIEPEGPI